MSDKPKALQMADELDRLGSQYDSEIAAELRRLHALNAELVEALQRFSNMYGHLWDSADTKGAGWLSPDSVKAYDDLHELVGELLRKVEASK